MAMHLLTLIYPVMHLEICKLAAIARLKRWNCSDFIHRFQIGHSRSNSTKEEKKYMRVCATMANKVKHYGSIALKFLFFN